jgi:hypothetical protein
MNLKNYDDLERKLLALGIPLLQALHIHRLAYDAGKQDKLRSGLIKMLIRAALNDPAMRISFARHGTFLGTFEPGSFHDGIFNEKGIDALIATSVRQKEYAGPKLIVIPDTNAFLINGDEARYQQIRSLFAELKTHPYVRVKEITPVTKERKGGLKRNPLLLSERDGSFIVKEIASSSEPFGLQKLVEEGLELHQRITREMDYGIIDLCREYCCAPTSLKIQDFGLIAERARKTLHLPLESRKLLTKGVEAIVLGKRENMLVDNLLVLYGIAHTIFNDQDQAMIFTGDQDIAVQHRIFEDVILPTYIAHRIVDRIDALVPYFNAGRSIDDHNLNVLFDAFKVKEQGSDVLKEQLIAAAQRQMHYFKSHPDTPKAAMGLVYNYRTDNVDVLSVASGLSRYVLEDPLYLNAKNTLIVDMALSGKSPEQLLREYAKRQFIVADINN